MLPCSLQYFLPPDLGVFVENVCIQRMKTYLDQTYLYTYINDTVNISILIFIEVTFTTGWIITTSQLAKVTFKQVHCGETLLFFVFYFNFHLFFKKHLSIINPTSFIFSFRGFISKPTTCNRCHLSVTKYLLHLFTPRPHPVFIEARKHFSNSNALFNISGLRHGRNSDDPRCRLDALIILDCQGKLTKI